ncbi:DUF4139 domain-containing protein [Bacillus sp. DJP31]|uniref:DUF4139 domain-containing protein n=1 Tax=Bacillus sp. DJP31 TaxID=3409789 RepID=UPI003BB67156
MILTKDSRKTLIATIYDHGTAFIEEKRQLSLGKSRTSLELKDLSPQIILDTLFVKDVCVHQQQIVHGVKSEKELLNHFIGKEILYQEDGQIVQQKAQVISATPEVIIQFIDTKQVVFNPTGRCIFPLEDLSLFMTTVSMDLTPTNDEITIFYGTNGFSWRMNYTLIVNGDVCHLKADCVFKNNCGMDLEDVHIQLMAGEVNIERFLQYSELKLYSDQTGSSEIDTFRVGGHHLLVLPEKISLESGKELFVNYFDVANIPIERVYTFLPNSSQCSITYTFENSKENNLFYLLPKGRAHIYEEHERVAFVGEVHVDKILPNQNVTLRSGITTNLSIKNKKEILSVNNEDYHHYRYTYTIKNKTDKNEKAQITHRFDRDDWEMLDFNQNPIDLNGKEITFEMRVAANSTEKLIFEYMEYSN